MNLVREILVFFGILASLELLSAPVSAKEVNGEKWNVTLGGGAAMLSLPWKGVGNQVTAIPFINASKGNWFFNLENLVGYRKPISDQFNVIMSLGVRQDGYNNFQFNMTQDGYEDVEKEPDHEIFEDYQSPSAEVVLNYGFSYRVISFMATSDVSSRSKSNSAKLAIGLPIYSKNDLTVSVMSSAQWSDSKYVNYFYGIEGENVDVIKGRVAYSSDEGSVNYTGGVSVTYKFNNKIDLAGGGLHTKLDEHITDSPLIDGESFGLMYLGATYKF